MSSYSYIALLINREQGAQSNEKENGYQRANGYLSNRNVTKRFNFSYTLIVLIVALVLLVFAIRAVKVEPVEQCQAQVMIIFVVHI